MRLCPANMRLPTIRELAFEAQAHGAKGILEVSQVNPNEVPHGYYKISAINSRSRQQKDEFYFSHEGYKRPEGDGGNNWFWSSSVNPKVTDSAHYISGFSGEIISGVRSYANGLVRCVTSDILVFD
jgi:hypothetical protein